MIRELYQPKSIKEALLLKAKIKDVVWLAGGTQLNSSLTSFQLQAAISLGNIEFGTVNIEPSSIIIGAGITLQALCENTEIPGTLRWAVLHITNRNIRNIATLGGNIAANQPYSAIIPTLIALKACLKLARKSGIKTVSMEEYIKSQKNDLIVAVEIPHTSVKISQRVFRFTANDLPLIIIAVGISREKDQVTDAVVALGGLNPVVIRLASVEKLIAKSGYANESTIKSLIKTDKIVTGQADIRGSMDFKRHIAAVLVMEAIQEAMKI
jgi:putative selenate reductase FAD-binding subunit